MWVTLVVILPLCWKGITCQVPGYSIEVASSVRVQEGLCVTIPCTFTADGRNTFSNTSGYWMRTPLNPYYIVATNDKSSVVQKSNFHLTGNPDTGDCTLTVTDARAEDEGEYYFRFVEREDSNVKYNYIREMTTAITVTDLTQQEPVISDLGTVIAGVDKTVTCAPPGNYLATSFVFQWKKSNVAGIWKSSPTVTFTPSLNDDQKTITCEMTNSKGKTTRKTILLDVCCPTSITIPWGGNGQKIDNPDFLTVDEGSSVTLRCSVQCNLTLDLTWTDGKNEVLQNGIGNELELRLENMSMNHTGTYTCSASTDYVINSTSINITVQYPPRNMEITIRSSKGGELPASQQVAIGETETLTLVCRVDGNPTSTVVWVKGEADTETSNMSIRGLSSVINVTSSRADVYRCLAWNALGVRERRIRVGTKQDTFRYWDAAIGSICGLGVTVLIILLYKLITWKKMTKKKTYVRAEEPCARVEPPTEDIYMNTRKPEQKDEEAADNSIQLNSNGVTSDQEDLHYSTVAFTAKPHKVPSSQPETEYAEVQVK